MKSLALPTILALIGAVAAAPAGGEEVAILKQNVDIGPDGTYRWEYETSDGIAAEESGAPAGESGAIAVSGQYKYTDPEGNPVQVTYVADENGFRPEGSHLPVGPPIPDAIQRALDYIAAHPPPPEA